MSAANARAVDRVNEGSVRARCRELRRRFYLGDRIAMQLYRLIVVKIASPRQVAYIDLRSARAPTVLFK